MCTNILLERCARMLIVVAFVEDWKWGESKWSFFPSVFSLNFLFYVGV